MTNTCDNETIEAPTPNSADGSFEPANTTVLIPAAGQVREGILSLSSIATPAMIPVAGLPVVHWSLAYLTGLGVTRFRIAVPRRGLSIEDHVHTAFGSKADFDWIVPSADRGPGGTVIDLLGDVVGGGLVVLGDTLFEFGSQQLPADRPWLLTGPVEDSERWCVVTADDRGFVTTWHNKEPGLTGELAAAAGIYYFPDCRAAEARGQTLLETGRPIDISSVLIEAAGGEPILAAPAGAWRDCGNPDTQELSRRQLLQERSFNSLEFDDRIGTVRKSSTHREKFIDEINFLRLLPPRVGALFPALVDYSVEWADPWLEMDYCAYPTLTELYLFEQLPNVVWARIFDRLNALLMVFAEYERPVSSEDLMAMYIGKARERLAQVSDSPHLRTLLEAESLEINGTLYPNLPLMLDEAHSQVVATVGDAKGCIMHGDLCFSNVLYDVRTGACKLLDPRGSFGRSGIHGDQRYDVAKLHHSLVGHYDHLVAGLFDLAIDGRRIHLHAHVTPSQARIERLYRSELLAAWDEQQIELITGLIFVGLPAMHTESSKRQIAFYVRAVELMGSALGQGEGS